MGKLTVQLEVTTNSFSGGDEGVRLLQMMITR